MNRCNEGTHSNKFIPQINPHSNEIDKRSRSREKSMERWEALYEMNQQIIAERKIEQEKNEERKLMSDLQFPYKPQLISHYQVPSSDTIDAISQLLSAGSKHGSQSKLSLNTSIKERTIAWEQRRDEKLQAIINKDKEKEAEQCTFKPSVNHKRSASSYRAKIRSNSKSVSVNQKNIVRLRLHASRDAWR